MSDHPRNKPVVPSTDGDGRAHSRSGIEVWSGRPGVPAPKPPRAWLEPAFDPNDPVDLVTYFSRDGGPPLADPPVADVAAGDVVTIEDELGVHTAFVLNVVGSSGFVLILTTNPGWNNRCRLATSDELAFTGFPSRRVTYLAPVVRSTYLMRKRGELPSHRVGSLLAEFGPRL